jgi:hypothetical protein
MLQFVREIPIRIVFKKALLQKQGFLFRVAAGFSKKIDPLSGMSVNLVSVDRWLSELKNILESAEQGADLVSVAQKFLETQAQTEGAILQSLNFREERGGGFSWRHNMPLAAVDISHDSFHDCYFQEGYGLYKMTITWNSLIGLWPAVSSEEALIVEALQSGASESEVQKILSQLQLPPVQTGLALKSIQVLNCALDTSWCIQF